MKCKKSMILFPIPIVDMQNVHLNIYPPQLGQMLHELKFEQKIIFSTVGHRS